jgi:hypothetical protein
MNSWFSKAFASATPTVTHKVTVGRPMPLKKPRSDQSAIPKGPPNMRGNQYSSASRRVSWGMSKGAKIHEPSRLSQRNSGTVISEAQRAVQVACDARVNRRAP